MNTLAKIALGTVATGAVALDRKSGSAGMPRPISHRHGSESPQRFLIQTSHASH